jgi:hypothetical protein
MGKIVRRVLDGYITLIEWSPSDPATVEAAEKIFRREVEGGFMAVVEDDGVQSGEPVRSADIVATRAIGIDAPPSAIWPWLVQMGPGRAGADTCDWVENLFGLNMHSVDRVHAEWQDLQVGDVLRSREDRTGMRVEILDPERTLSTRSEAGDWAWTFVLVGEDGWTRRSVATESR